MICDVFDRVRSFSMFDLFDRTVGLPDLLVIVRGRPRPVGQTNPLRPRLHTATSDDMLFIACNRQ
jgi:hypothetical protein